MVPKLETCLLATCRLLQKIVDQCELPPVLRKEAAEFLSLVPDSEGQSYEAITDANISRISTRPSTGSLASSGLGDLSPQSAGCDSKSICSAGHYNLDEVDGQYEKIFAEVPRSQVWDYPLSQREKVVRVLQLFEDECAIAAHAWALQCKQRPVPPPQDKHHAPSLKRDQSASGSVQRVAGTATGCQAPLTDVLQRRRPSCGDHAPPAAAPANAARSGRAYALPAQAVPARAATASSRHTRPAVSVAPAGNYTCLLPRDVGGRCAETSITTMLDEYFDPCVALMLGGPI